MKQLFLFSICFLTVSHFSFSQDDEKKGPRLNDNRAAFKFSPMQMIIGEFNIGVEFQTSKKTSLEIELGPTISEIGFARLDFMPPEDGDNVSENSNIGFFGSIGFRYYPLEVTEALNRMYVSPILKYRMYNFTLSENSDNLDDIMASKSQAKFLFNFGYQLWASKSFGFDFYLGTGVGFQQITDYDAIAVYDPATFVYTYEWDKQSSSKPQMLLNAGVKMVFGL